MCMHRTPPAHFSAALFFLACVTAFLLLGLDAQRQEVPATAPLPAPPSPSLTQTVAEISANDLRLHVTALASEAMGRSVFGFYLEEGLRGWADGYGEGKRDGHVSVRELAAFVGARVDR